MNKTVSLDTARKLKEAGWQGNGEWSWVIMKNPDHTQLSHSYDAVAWRHNKGWEFFPAPDVSELLEALPICTLERCKVNDVELYCYRALYLDQEDKNDLDALAETPAEALAALYLELKAKSLL